MLGSHKMLFTQNLSNLFYMVMYVKLIKLIVNKNYNILGQCVIK